MMLNLEYLMVKWSCPAHQIRFVQLRDLSTPSSCAGRHNPDEPKSLKQSAKNYLNFVSSFMGVISKWM